MSNIDKQALREAATEATQGGWYVDYDFDVCHEGGAFLAETHGDNLVQNAKFIAAANPVTMLALLDELEAAKRERDNWRTSFDNERFRADKLAEAFKTEHEQLLMSNSALITQHMRANGAESRIAELEARTVKLPYLPADCDRTEAHFKYQEAIRAAGIQVIEGEQKNG